MESYFFVCTVLFHQFFTLLTDFSFKRHPITRNLPTICARVLLTLNATIFHFILRRPIGLFNTTIFISYISCLLGRWLVHTANRPGCCTVWIRFTHAAMTSRYCTITILFHLTTGKGYYIWGIHIHDVRIGQTPLPRLNPRRRSLAKGQNEILPREGENTRVLKP